MSISRFSNQNKKGKIVIGWDVGLVNLSFAVIEYISYNNWKILHWSLIDTGAKMSWNNVKKLSTVVDTLNSVKNKIIPTGFIIDSVRIESQQRSIQIMKKIETLLISFYLINGIDYKKIKLMGSKSKFAIDTSLKNVPKGNSGYNMRKLLSEKICRKCICHNIRYLSYFDNAKKKNDLSDSLLLALHDCGHKI